MPRHATPRHATPRHSIRLAVLSLVLVAFIVIAPSSGSTSDDCVCEYQLPCCTPQSVLVECLTIHGLEYCPWDWDTYAENTLTRNDCSEGVERGTQVVSIVANSDQCRYREGICLGGFCTFSDWIVSKCQPLDVFIIGGVPCP